MSPLSSVGATDQPHKEAEQNAGHNSRIDKVVDCSVSVDQQR